MGHFTLQDRNLSDLISLVRFRMPKTAEADLLIATYLPMILADLIAARHTSEIEKAKMQFKYPEQNPNIEELRILPPESGMIQWRNHLPTCLRVPVCTCGAFKKE